MAEIYFRVQGSTAEPYVVTFRSSGLTLGTQCNCASGKHGLCKHSLAILEGNAAGIVSDNRDAIQIVQEWLNTSNIQPAIADLRHSINLLKDAESEATRLKKMIQRMRQNLTGMLKL